MSEPCQLEFRSRLLLINEVPGEPMPVDCMREFFTSMAGLGLEGVRIAFVDTQFFKTPLMKTAEILASEYGFGARAFDNEFAAQSWLRHGAN